jgi:iron(III) transport system substrate-binding protein
MEENPIMADRSRSTPAMHRLRLLALAATLAMVAAACTGDNETAEREPAVPDARQAADGDLDDTLTVYSRGDDRELFTLFEQQTGIKVRSRWGQLDDLAEQVIEDGPNSPADVFYAPVSDSLGLVSAAGRLATLSDAQLDRVPKQYRSPDDTWVGTSGRTMVMFYNTDLLSADDLPDSILGFADPAWRGRIGWDPANRALQGAITAMRQTEGEARTRAWLEGIQANQPAVLSGPRSIATAVAAGELIQVGFGNHFYLYELQAEGKATNVAAKFYPGDPAGLLQVAGVGIVKGTDNQAAANAFVDFLLSPTAQRHLAEASLEIPVVEGIAPPKGAPTASELAVPGLELRRLEDLDDTRELLTEVGIIM